MIHEAPVQRKVCVLGAYGAGKTSLVSRFAHGTFSGRYESTVGVRIDPMDVEVDGRTARLAVWDLHGEDDLQSVRPSHLSDAAGFLVVVDGTRRDTLTTARELVARARQAAGGVPVVVVLNKRDLEDDWEVPTPDADSLGGPGVTVLSTSARTGEGVREAFAALAMGVMP